MACMCTGHPHTHPHSHTYVHTRTLVHPPTRTHLHTCAYKWAPCPPAGDNSSTGLPVDISVGELTMLRHRCLDAEQRLEVEEQRCVSRAARGGGRGASAPWPQQGSACYGILRLVDKGRMWPALFDVWAALKQWCCFVDKAWKWPWCRLMLGRHCCCGACVMQQSAGLPFPHGAATAHAQLSSSCSATPRRVWHSLSTISLFGDAAGAWRLCGNWSMRSSGRWMRRNTPTRPAGVGGLCARKHTRTAQRVPKLLCAHTARTCARMRRSMYVRMRTHPLPHPTTQPPTQQSFRQHP